MNQRSAGWSSGFLGMLIFSGSLPATRVAVGAFSPMFLTSARAVIAAVIGACCLLAFRERWPIRSHMLSLAVVALGVVVGFPLLTSLALEHITASRSIVFLGLLPLATAIFGVVRGGEKPKLPFWVFAVFGAVTVAAFALTRSGAGSASGDLLMVAAIVLCGLGYAEGARLSRSLGGWQVISWALLLASPALGAVALLTSPSHWAGLGVPAWISLGYVSVFSMFVGFVFWYRGLALGGIASVGQLQLLQPFFGLALAAIVLHETIAWTMIAAAALVMVCVAGARRFAS